MPLRDFSTGLFTDLYQLTMAQAYWQSGRTARATFSLFFRSYPPDRGYFVFAGLPEVLTYLREFGFDREDVASLRGIDLFDDDFLTYLETVRFTGDVRALPEGTIFFPNEPVIEVSAPIIEAQIVETFLVNQINFLSLLATKASRVVHVARGRTVVDFAARRTHGTEAANGLARVSYMTGFAGTSNVLAGALHGIPTYGTMAHSFVTAFESEIEAFRAYAGSFPDSSTFLVDTYDTLEGTRRAVEVAREMDRRGHRLQAIRLDSGDLLDLSFKTRAQMDEAGLHAVKVFASGGLDEFAVDRLLRSGAPIDGFGVGTKVGVSADAPWTDCAYKMVEYDGRPVLKLSAGKETLPGPKQVYRFRDRDGRHVRDVICLHDEPPPGGGPAPLLEEVVKGGAAVQTPPPLKTLRRRFSQEFAGLPDDHKTIRSPALYPVTTGAGLDVATKKLTARAAGM